jgi:hypothetical protein
MSYKVKLVAVGKFSAKLSPMVFDIDACHYSYYSKAPLFIFGIY